MMYEPFEGSFFLKHDILLLRVFILFFFSAFTFLKRIICPFPVKLALFVEVDKGVTVSLSASAPP